MNDLERLKAMLFQNPEFKEYYLDMQPEEDIAIALVAVRMERDWTQAELAKHVGIPQADISRLESCDAKPTLKTLKRIAKALNMRLKISFVPREEE